MSLYNVELSFDNRRFMYKDFDYRRKIFDNNGYRVIFLHLYKEPSKWKEHLMNYLELISNYRNRKLSEILRKEN